jgi:hypothetical protein
MYKTEGDILPKVWCEKNVISAGLNYFPVRGIVIKAEYSLRQFKSPYNDEPAIGVGIAYSGFFKR